MQRFLSFFLFLAFLQGCAQHGKLQVLTNLPSKIDECSGIIYMGEKEAIWLIEDGGNADNIYKVGFDGKFQEEFDVKDAENKDWEDLAYDKDGNVYIPDFGNNGGKREDFTIYKLPDPRIEKGDHIPSEKIEFSYPESGQDRTPDAEALFFFEDDLYIVTKDRSRPFRGEARFYRVPAAPGNYVAELTAVVPTCAELERCQVTAADLSPDGRTLVLLGYGQLWIFRNLQGLQGLEERMEVVDLQATTQLESVCFLDAETLLLADEIRAGSGGNLYTFNIGSETETQPE